MYTWQIRSQILNLGQNILHIQIKCLVLNLQIFEDIPNLVVPSLYSYGPLGSPGLLN